MPLSKSPAINAALLTIGIKSVEDVVNHLPRRYESFALTPRKDVYKDKERIVRLGMVKAPFKSLRFSSRSLTSFSFLSMDGEAFRVEAWNRPYLATSLKEGTLYTIVGSYSLRRHTLSLVSILVGEVKEGSSLRPVYSLPASIPNRVFASLVKRSLENMKEDYSLPESLVRKYRLLSRLESLRKVHMPSSNEDIHDGYRRLKYEEALDFSLKVAMVRGENRALKKDYRRKIDVEMLNKFILSLPYKLTEDQAKAIEEARKDMDDSHVMYRLLQGDVGTGKTMVAALLAYANHTRSEQTALLAPTEILARQHYKKLTSFFEGTNMNIALLLGSTPSEEKAAIYRDLEDGTIDLVIGTHALFSKAVTYAYLGLAIIDEQHKFGVNQRSLLLGKGEHADLLLMSATPIPRTLSLTIYGDLDISSLYLFPGGKRKVKTLLVEEDDPSIDKAIKESLAKNRRIYVVAPQIETSENSLSVKEIYSRYYRKYGQKVTMVHGKMDEESRNVAMMAFYSGLCPILVATSLIEVGVDVKEADLMLVYSPSRFGLSSLHQLRGRIGRGGEEASFIMVNDSSDEEARSKLEALVSLDDGFKIAEEDLKMRGPGEIAGTRQSGLPDFGFANPIDDFKIFECARDDATYIMLHEDDPSYSALLDKARRESEATTLA